MFQKGKKLLELFPRSEREYISKLDLLDLKVVGSSSKLTMVLSLSLAIFINYGFELKIKIIVAYYGFGLILTTNF